MKKRLIAIAVWLLIWELAARLIDNVILIAGPIDTALSLVNSLGKVSFYMSVLTSFVRITLGFLAGSTLGMIMGTMSHRWDLFKTFISPFISLLKTVPVACFVVILLVWFGSSWTSFFISMMITLPVLYYSTLKGLENVPKDMLEVRSVYKMTGFRSFRYITFPAVHPYLVAAFETAIGMAWKSGVAAEVIGQAQNTLGNSIYISKIYLDTAGLFSWTIVVVICSFVFEKLFIMLFKSLVRK